MASFSAEWLALREPADHAARDESLTRALAAALATRLGSSGRAGVHAVDLAAGTGSNVRYLLPRLPQVSRWTLVDHDAALLDVARRSIAPLAGAGVTIGTQVADLRDLDALPLGDCALVTGSALLDLVASPWLAALAAHCASAGAHVLFALSYDGRLSCTPDDPWDARVRELVNAHQRTDKGFGPALGPDASDAARMAFSTVAGGPTAPYTVHTGESDWVLSPSDAELQRQLVTGWAQAASEMAPAEASDIASWRVRRFDAIALGASTIRVGHQDLLAT